MTTKRIFNPDDFVNILTKHKEGITYVTGYDRKTGDLVVSTLGVDSIVPGHVARAVAKAWREKRNIPCRAIRVFKGERHTYRVQKTA